MRNIIGDGKKTISLRSAAKRDDANEISSEKDINEENTNTLLTKREFGMKTFAFTSLSLFASSSSPSQKEAFADDGFFKLKLLGESQPAVRTRSDPVRHRVYG